MSGGSLPNGREVFGGEDGEEGVVIVSERVTATEGHQI